MYSSDKRRTSTSRRSPEYQVRSWLRARIHPYCWGQSDCNKKNLRQTKKQRILGFFESLRSETPRRFLRKMTNEMMIYHFLGWYILYFQADGRYGTEETLIESDVDCHARGSYAGACECVEWLIANGFPGLFWSRSTNRRGVHAYLCIDKRGYGDFRLDAAMGKLERWLQYQHYVQGWDIENIEVKGRPPIFKWGKAKYEVLDIRMGTLAKLPVEALDRPEQLMATTRLTVCALNRLGAQVPQDWVKRTSTCSTYSFSINDEQFGQLDPKDLEPFTPEVSSREWVFWVEKMARSGLVEEDTMDVVVYELAKWLLWVELVDLDDKVNRTVELLQTYVETKDNGYITRINEGKTDEVLSQVERIVKAACEVSCESEELFSRIRDKRESGEYQRIIKIAKSLEWQAEVEVGGLGLKEQGYTCSTYCFSIRTDPSSETEEPSETPGLREQGYTCSTYCFSIRTDPLPDHLEAKIAEYARIKNMRMRDGEYPIIRFARQFLNLLLDNKGSARIHTETLTRMVGNVNQQNTYKQALWHLDLIGSWTGTYRAKTVSARYSLTAEARQAFEMASGHLTRAKGSAY